MFMLSFLFALIAFVVYLCTPRMQTASRILLALSVFIVGVGGMIGLLFYGGDRSAPCSRTVYANLEVGPPENCG